MDDFEYEEEEEELMDVSNNESLKKLDDKEVIYSYIG